MSKYQGNIITKNPATPTGPASYGSASGMWSLADAEYWKKQGLWPIPGSPGSDYITTLVNASNRTTNLSCISQYPGTGTSSAGAYNLYGFGSAYMSSPYNSQGMLFTKYNKDGTLQFQKASSELNYSNLNIAVDSSENVYFFGGNSSQQYSGYLIKLNSSGTIVWKNYLSFYASYISTSYNAMILDNSENIIISGYRSAITCPTTISASSHLVSISPSGTINWQVKYQGGSPYSAVVQDGTYVYRASATQMDVYNVSTGAYVTSYAFGNNIVNYSGDATLYNSNIYTVAAGLFSTTTTGTSNWYTTLTGTDSTYILTTASYTSLSFAGDGIVIAKTAYTSGSTACRVIIAKYNFSGTLMWQRYISTTSNWVELQSAGQSVVFDGAGNITVTVGYKPSGATNVSSVTIKYPVNGSITGNYTVGSDSFTIGTSAYTSAKFTQSSASPTSRVDSANTYSMATYTSAVNFVARTYTSTTVTI